MLNKLLSSILISFLFLSSMQIYLGQGTQLNTFDDVDINIRAGAYEITNGNYGLGFLVYIKNNLNESIAGEIIVYWNITDGINIRMDKSPFDLSPMHPEIQVGYIDWIHFPFPILKLKVKVEVNDMSVSRGGIEIGPFVFFY